MVGLPALVTVIGLPAKIDRMAALASYALGRRGALDGQHFSCNRRLEGAQRWQGVTRGTA